MKIFITGLAGFIGSHLSEALLKTGHDVSGVDNLNDFYAPILKKKNLAAIEATAQKLSVPFTFNQGDIRDEEKISELLSQFQPDVIVHLAAMAGVRPSIQNPLLYEEVNGKGTLVLLESMHKLGIKNFVFGSSSSVYGLNQKVPFSESDEVSLPYSPYAQTKRAGELQCRVYHELYKLNVACLRFFTVYGPRQRPDLAIRKFTELILSQKPIPVFGDGSFARDFTYVDDIIDGITKSIDWVLKGTSNHPRYDIFNLGESATTTVNQLIKLLEESIGLPALRDDRPAMAGDVPITYADISKSRKILGYDPHTKIEEGIPRFVEWIKKIR